MSIERCYWCDENFDTDKHPEQCPHCEEPYDDEPTEAQLESYYDTAAPAERRERDERELRDTGRR